MAFGLTIGLLVNTGGLLTAPPTRPQVNCSQAAATERSDTQGSKCAAVLIRRNEKVGLPASQSKGATGRYPIKLFHVFTTARLAMSGAKVLTFKSAATNWPDPTDLNAINPPPASTTWNCSEVPIAVRSATSALPRFRIGGHKIPRSGRAYPDGLAYRRRPERSRWVTA